MLKKNITFTNYMTGEKETRAFYFDFSAAELALMHMTTPGGMDARLERMMNTKDSVEFTKLVRSFIVESYGERSDDGVYFYKKDAEGHSLGEKFTQTDAYNVLFMELFRDAKKCAAFINAIIPKELRRDISSFDEGYIEEINKEAEDLIAEKDKANKNMIVIDSEATVENA